MGAAIAAQPGLARSSTLFATFDTLSSLFAHKVGEVIRGAMRLAR
jgi:hypothetical protein